MVKLPKMAHLHGNFLQKMFSWEIFYIQYGNIYVAIMIKNTYAFMALYLRDTKLNLALYFRKFS
jgi:hypothetical protein